MASQVSQIKIDNCSFFNLNFSALSNIYGKYTFCHMVKFFRNASYEMDKSTKLSIWTLCPRANFNINWRWQTHCQFSKICHLILVKSIAMTNLFFFFKYILSLHFRQKRSESVSSSLIFIFIVFQKGSDEIRSLKREYIEIMTYNVM